MSKPVNRGKRAGAHEWAKHLRPYRKRVAAKQERAAHTVRISDGKLQFVYADELAELLDEGDASVCRVSHVEPHEGHPGQWTADMSPVDGPVLGPFGTRAEALDAERQWLSQERGL